MSFDLAVLSTHWLAFARGLATTLLICILALPVGFAAGTGLAFIRLYGPRPARSMALAYVELVRNIPFLILVFLLFFALPLLCIRLDATVAGTLALTCYAIAYFAEIVRGAIATIAPGQTEAARALGLSIAAVFRLVLIPQTRGYIVPAAGNTTITLLKESSILSVIAVPELTYTSQDIIGRTFAPVEVFTLVALLYWALTAILARMTAALERPPHPAASMMETRQ